MSWKERKTRRKRRERERNRDPHHSFAFAKCKHTHFKSWKFIASSFSSFHFSFSSFHFSSLPSSYFSLTLLSLFLTRQISWVQLTRSTYEMMWEMERKKKPQAASLWNREKRKKESGRRVWKMNPKRREKVDFSSVAIGMSVKNLQTFLSPSMFSLGSKVSLWFFLRGRELDSFFLLSPGNKKVTQIHSLTLERFLCERGNDVCIQWPFFLSLILSFSIFLF